MQVSDNGSLKEIINSVVYNAKGTKEQAERAYKIATLAKKEGVSPYLAVAIASNESSWGANEKAKDNIFQLKGAAAKKYLTQDRSLEAQVKAFASYIKDKASAGWSYEAFANAGFKMDATEVRQARKEFNKKALDFVKNATPKELATPEGSLFVSSYLGGGGTAVKAVKDKIKDPQELFNTLIESKDEWSKIMPATNNATLGTYASRASSLYESLPEVKPTEASATPEEETLKETPKVEESKTPVEVKAPVKKNTKDLVKPVISNNFQLGDFVKGFQNTSKTPITSEKTKTTLDFLKTKPKETSKTKDKYSEVLKRLFRISTTKYKNIY